MECFFVGTTTKNIINKLDKRFIDREELKKKIKKWYKKLQIKEDEESISEDYSIDDNPINAVLKK